MYLFLHNIQSLLFASFAVYLTAFIYSYFLRIYYIYCRNVLICWRDQRAVSCIFLRRRMFYTPSRLIQSKCTENKTPVIPDRPTNHDTGQSRKVCSRENVILLESVTYFHTAYLLIQLWIISCKMLPW